MEGPQGALNGKPHAHKTDGHDQRHPVFPGLPQQQDALLHVAQEQVPGHIVEEADAKQQKPRAHEAHDHIAHPRRNGQVIEFPQDQPAGRNGTDLHKHIGGKEVIGVYQRQVGRQHQVRHDIVKIRLIRFQIPACLFHAAPQCQQHDHAEQQRHGRLQHACTQFVSPGRREVAHHIHIALPRPHQKRQQEGGHHPHRPRHAQAEPPGRFPFQRGRNDCRKHGG